MNVATHAVFPARSGVLVEIAAAGRDSTLVEAVGLGHGGILKDTDSIRIVTDFVRRHVAP